MIDRRVPVGHGDGSLDGDFGSLVGDADGALVLETATGHENTEDGSLMTATTAAVELRGSTELARHTNQSRLEQPMRLEVVHQRTERLIEPANEFVLFHLAVVVGVPTGAVGEVQIVEDLDEPHALLNEPPTEQATLPELGAVTLTQLGGFRLEVEGFAKSPTRQGPTLVDEGIVFHDRIILAARLADGLPHLS